MPFDAAMRVLEDGVQQIGKASGRERGLWGVLESVVADVKRARYHIYRPNHPGPLDSCHTAVVVVEGLINARPLTATPEEVDDPDPITPAHFLSGGAHRQLAAPPAQGWGSRQNWNLLQKDLDRLWARFCQEMMMNLQTQAKWFKIAPELNPGDVVIVLDKKKRGVWPLAKVIRTEIGRDGLARQADVLLHGHTLRRAVNNLILLTPAGHSSSGVLHGVPRPERRPEQS